MLNKLLTISGFKIALLTTLIVIGMFSYNTLVFDPEGNFIDLLDKQWVDFILKERDVQPHTSEVVIATIDTKSVDMYGRWPWPRARMAQMIEALNKYEVATIGLDIVFSEPEQGGALSISEEYNKQFSRLNFGNNPKATQFVRFMNQTKDRLDGDAKFGRELAKQKNTVLGYFFFTNEGDLKHVTPEDREKAASLIRGSEISALMGTIGDGFIPKGAVPEPNIPKISNSGNLSGFFNMNPDVEDGTVRRVHLLMQYGENVYPNLDLQMLRHYMGAEGIIVHADEATGNVLAVQIGNMIVPTNYDGSILLNYKGPSSTFPHISIYDIIEGKVPKEELEGKLVLVGATEVGVFDLRTTPVGVAYPGVEVHATLLDNLLTGTYFQISDANHAATALILLIIGLLLGVTLPNLKSIYGSVLAFGLLGGYLFAHRWMVNNMLTWTSAMYVVLLIILCWAGVTLFRFLVTDKDKRFIKNAFQQYLSPDVINQLMDNPDLLKLGGERREMTAFFSDVAGFSSISEILEPEELVQLLNVYLTEMSNIIMEYGGTVDKYEGDAIIAFFGAPMNYPDHAVRACHVAVDMQRKLAEMREGWEKEGKPLLKMRIGLNTGPMVVGNMGSENRFDYTMMGNSVNLAARLEGANKNYGSYDCISEMTYEPAKDHIEVRELDLIRVVGINTPVRIYELCAKKGELSETQAKGFPYYLKGLELYRKQQWDEAIKYFKAAMKIIPEDPPSAEFIRRCEDFKANPPGDEWDGVFTATSK